MPWRADLSKNTIYNFLPQFGSRWRRLGGAICDFVLFYYITRWSILLVQLPADDCQGTSVTHYSRGQFYEVPCLEHITWFEYFHRNGTKMSAAFMMDVLVVIAPYFVVQSILMLFFSKTIGKLIFRTEVVDGKTFEKSGWARGYFLRSYGIVAVMLLFGCRNLYWLGLIQFLSTSLSTMVLALDDSQAVHDLLVRTKVIRTGYHVARKALASIGDGI